MRKYRPVRKEAGVCHKYHLRVRTPVAGKIGHSQGTALPQDKIENENENENENDNIKILRIKFRNRALLA